MWVQELTLENIKCFERTSFKLGSGDGPYPWVTLLGENGGGKSTVLQALGVLLAGAESVQSLLPRPVGWLRDQGYPGLIKVQIHQGDDDSGQFGTEKIRKSFGYSFNVTGTKRLIINNKHYNEPAVFETANSRKHHSWLRQNAYAADAAGWFAAGYGPFRRLTHEDQIVVPSPERHARYTNFLTQFDEDEPLSTFERWFVYLDYRISKGTERSSQEARRQRDLAAEAINDLLPDDTRYSHVTEEGRVMFTCGGADVPTSSLSDGYRSTLAVAGDLVWRLMLAFPQSDNPLSEEGVVLIDELDIHLHPTWQRDIAGWLRSRFPNIQFIVATHSPFIAVGAGPDAVTLRLRVEDGDARVRRVRDLSASSVDDVLRSPAFGLVSTFSPQTQERLDRFDELGRKRGKRSRKEEEEYGQLSLFVKEARPYGGPPPSGSLDEKITDYLEKSLQ